jgi:uncharacterized protein YjbI with pentapeptide repeats
MTTMKGGIAWMADQQHVALLKQGVDVWNRWKQEHQQIQPDFTGAHLTGADLQGADLTGANLTNTVR